MVLPHPCQVSKNSTAHVDMVYLGYCTQSFPIWKVGSANLTPLQHVQLWRMGIPDPRDESNWIQLDPRLMAEKVGFRWLAVVFVCVFKCCHVWTQNIQIFSSWFFDKPITKPKEKTHEFVPSKFQTPKLHQVDIGSLFISITFTCDSLVLFNTCCTKLGKQSSNPHKMGRINCLCLKK